MTTTPKAKSARRASKVRLVPVAEMRTPTVLVTQRRFVKAQAEAYAAAFDLDKFGIPIVNHKGGVYWILDGQHRIAALKLWFAPNDPGSVDCEVYDDLPDNEAADIFLGRDDRRAISTFEKFHVACTAGRTRECDIKKTVEDQKLKVSQTKSAGCVGAVSALTSVYDRGGAVVLGQVLRTLRDAYASDPAAFDTKLIQGLGLVFNRYNGKTEEKWLVGRLSAVQHGVRGVLQRAEQQRERTGNQMIPCVAATIVEIFNKGVRTPAQRLPSWWKSTEESCKS